MFWFKNAMIYKLTQGLDLTNLDDLLVQNAHTPCGKADVSKFGFTPPLTTSESLSYQASGQILLVTCKEERILPSHVVKKECDSRISELEKKEERKLKKTEKLAIKDDVIATLLPQAFTKSTFTAIWIDTQANLIYVDTSSEKRAENNLALLRKTFGSLPVVPLAYEKELGVEMRNWILNKQPDWLELGENAELKNGNEGNSAKFKNQDLQSEEVETFLVAGGYVSILALEWESHLRFTLHENGKLTGLKFSDNILEQNDDAVKEDIAQRFDADFLLMTNELKALIEKLGNEFGFKARD